MVKTKTIFKGDSHSKVTQFRNSLVVGGATNLEGEAQTVSVMMPIRKCLEMILLAFK